MSKGISILGMIFSLGLALLLTGCGSIGRRFPSMFSFRQYSFTPSQAITREILEHSNVQNFKLLGTRRTPDGKVAGIYTFSESGKSSQPGAYTNGYSVAERVNLIQWRVMSTGFYEHDLPPKKSIPIDYEVLREGYTAVFGPVISEDVIAVEADFAGGETIRENISDGYFLIFSPEGKEVCEIRAIGAGEKLLYQSSLSKLYLESNACPGNLPN